MSVNGWEVIDLADVKERLKGEAVEYLEFLNVPSLTCGLYALSAGSKDMQAPHDEDEVYYVIAGRARVKVGGHDRVVEPGSILYVSATSDHSFFEIEEDITLLVFFGSPS